MIVIVQVLYHFCDVIFECLRELLMKRRTLRVKCKEDLTQFEVTLTAEAHFDSDLGIVFWPPVYTQRYAAVSDILKNKLWNGQISKVVDFGCSELSLVRYLKNVDGIETIICVDLDCELLTRCKRRADPLITDYVIQRSAPLEIKILEGSAADPDYRLIGCDAVICVELIEHMDPQDLERLVHTVFGFVRPRIAIFTTPNSDFNILFDKMKENGFRHDDHRFEWTRDQFNDWSFNIVGRYPNYSVQSQGVGPGPPNTSHLGCCSQLALFINNSYTKLASFDVEDPKGFFTSNNFKKLMMQNEIDLSPDDLKARDFYENILEAVIRSRRNDECVSLRRDTDDPHLIDMENRTLHMSLLVDDYFNDTKKEYVMGLAHSLSNFSEASRLNCSSKVCEMPLIFDTLFEPHFDKEAADVATNLIMEDTVALKLTQKVRFESPGRRSFLWYNINWADDAPAWFDYYKVIAEIQYPYRVDHRTLPEKIVDEVTFKLQTFVNFGEKYYNENMCRWEVPLEGFMPYLTGLTKDINLLRQCLYDRGYVMNNDHLIYTEETPSESFVDEYQNCNVSDTPVDPADEVEPNEAWDVDEDWGNSVQSDWNNLEDKLMDDSHINPKIAENDFTKDFMKMVNDNAFVPDRYSDKRSLRRSYSIENIPSFMTVSSFKSNLLPSEMDSHMSFCQSISLPSLHTFADSAPPKMAESETNEEKSTNSAKASHQQSNWSDETKLYDSGYQKSQDSPLSPLLSFSSGLLTPDKDFVSEHPTLERILENLNCVDDPSDRHRRGYNPSEVSRPMDLDVRPMSPELDPIEIDSPLSFPLEPFVVRPLQPLFLPIEPLIQIDRLHLVQNIRLEPPNGDMLNNNQDYEGNLLIEEVRPPDIDAAAMERDIIEVEHIDCAAPDRSNTNFIFSYEKKRKLEISPKGKNKASNSSTSKVKSTPRTLGQGSRKGYITRICTSEKKNTFVGLTKIFHWKTSRRDCHQHNEPMPLNYDPKPYEQLSKKVVNNGKRKKVLRKYLSKSEIGLKSIQQFQASSRISYNSVSHQSNNSLHNEKIMIKRKIASDCPKKRESSRNDFNHKDVHADSEAKSDLRVNQIVKNESKMQGNVCICRATHINNVSQSDDMKNPNVKKNLSIAYFFLNYYNPFSEPCLLNIKPKAFVMKADKMKFGLANFGQITENLEEQKDFFPCGINLEEYFMFLKSTQSQKKIKSLYNELYSFRIFSQIGDTKLTVCNLSTDTSSCVSIQSLNDLLMGSQCSKSGAFTTRSEHSMPVPSVTASTRRIYGQYLSPAFHNILVDFTEANFGSMELSMNSNPLSKSCFEHLNITHSSSESSLSVLPRSICSAKSSNSFLKYLSLTNMITYRKYSKPEWRSKKPKYNMLNTICTNRKRYKSGRNAESLKQQNHSTFKENPGNNDHNSICGCTYTQGETLISENNSSIITHDIHNVLYFQSELKPKLEIPSENRDTTQFEDFSVITDTCKLKECIINGSNVINSMTSAANKNFQNRHFNPYESATVKINKLNNVLFAVDYKTDDINSKGVFEKIHKIENFEANVGCECDPTKCQYSNESKSRRQCKNKNNSSSVNGLCKRKESTYKPKTKNYKVCGQKHTKQPQQLLLRSSSKHIKLNSTVQYEKNARLYEKNKRDMKTISNQCKIDSREGLNTNASSITEKSKYFNRKLDSYFTSGQHLYASTCNESFVKEKSFQSKLLKNENHKSCSNTKSRKKSKLNLTEFHRNAKKALTRVFHTDTILKNKCCNGFDKLFTDLIQGIFITDRCNEIRIPESNRFKIEKRTVQRLATARAHFKLSETMTNTQSEESESELEDDSDNNEKLPDNCFKDEIDQEEIKNISSSSENITNSDDSFGVEEEPEEMDKVADIDTALILDEEVNTVPELTPKRPTSVRMFHKIHTLGSRIRTKRKKTGSSTVSTMTNKSQMVIKPTRRRFFRTKYTNTKKNSFPKMCISEASQYNVQKEVLKDGVRLTMEFPELKCTEPKTQPTIHNVGDLICKCVQTDVNSCNCNQWIEQLHKEIPRCVANSVRQSLDQQIQFDTVFSHKKKPKVKSSEIQTMNLGLLDEYKITKEEHDDRVRLIVDIPKDPTQPEEDLTAAKSKKKVCQKKKDKSDPSEWNQINISCKFKSKSEKRDQSKGEGTRAKKSWKYSLFGQKKRAAKSSSQTHEMVECDSAIQLDHDYSKPNITGDHNNLIVTKMTYPHFGKRVYNNYRVVTCDEGFQYCAETFSEFSVDERYVADVRSVDCLRKRYYKRQLNNGDKDDCIDNGESKCPSSTEIPTASNSGDDHQKYETTAGHITESGYKMPQSLLNTAFQDIGHLTPDEQSPGCSYNCVVSIKPKTVESTSVLKVLQDKSVKKDIENSQEEVELAKATKRTTNFQTPSTSGVSRHLYIRNNCSNDDRVSFNQVNVTWDTLSGLSLEDGLVHVQHQESVTTIVIPYEATSNGAIYRQSGSEEYFFASNDDSNLANFGIEENIFPGWLLNILQSYQQVEEHVAGTHGGADMLIPLAPPPPTPLRQRGGAGAGDGVGVHSNASSSSSGMVSSVISVTDSDGSNNAQEDPTDRQTLSSEDYQMLLETADEEYQPAHSYQAMDTIASEEINSDQFHTPTASDTCLSIQEPSAGHTMLLMGLRSDQQRGEHSSVSGIDGDISASDTEGQDCNT